MKRNTIPQTLCLCVTAGLLALVTGCQTGEQASTQPTPTPPAATAVTAVPAAASASAAAKKVVLPIRIKTGISAGFTDKDGHAWLPDQGFADGETIERPDLEIANASDPRIYQAERYSMTKFTQELPNGKYTVKLHFCETFDGITGPGDRVFSFNVQGKEFKGFDVWVKAGGPRKAYVETVPVEITDGKLVVTFTPDVENPEINAIEVLPPQ